MERLPRLLGELLTYQRLLMMRKAPGVASRSEHLLTNPNPYPCNALSARSLACQLSYNARSKISCLRRLMPRNHSDQAILLVAAFKSRDRGVRIRIDDVAVNR